VEALFVGVDGGGTSTRCVVAGETGKIAGRGRAGGANAVSVADPSANLLAALLAALEGVDRSRVAGGVFGLAGTGTSRPLAEQAWRAAGLTGRLWVVPDVLVAFTGATAAPDGSVLIAGTGAMGARIRARRVVRRADGLGWLLGDEGSGVWLGRRALVAMLAALDGRAAPTELTGPLAAAILGEETEAADLQALVAAVYARVAEAGPAWLATLAPLIDTAARQGDQVARDILREAARRLARTARVVGAVDGRQEDTRPLVLAGSLLTEQTMLARLVRAELGERATWVPARDGAAGAAALALRAAFPPEDPRALDGHLALIGQDGP
jgi:glucosamine kinase